MLYPDIIAEIKEPSEEETHLKEQQWIMYTKEKCPKLSSAKLYQTLSKKFDYYEKHINEVIETVKQEYSSEYIEKWHNWQFKRMHIRKC